jgi:hypothetical protein
VETKLHRLFLLALGLAFALGARIAHGQAAPPFFGGPVTAFDTEVSIVDSGALLDVEDVVSNDEKYVTLTVRADNSTVLALKQFQVQSVAAGSGFVGGVDPTGKTNVKAAHSLPSEIDRADRNAVSVLNRHGVYLLTPLR